MHAAAGENDSATTRA